MTITGLETILLGVDSIYSGGNKFIVFCSEAASLQNTTNLFPLLYVMPCALLAHMILLSFCPDDLLSCCLFVLLFFCHVVFHPVAFLFYCHCQYYHFHYIVLIIWFSDIMMLLLNNSDPVTSTLSARDAIASKNGLDPHFGDTL